MRRIRYVKQIDGSLISVQVMRSMIGDVKSLILPDGKSGKVIRIDGSGDASDVITATSSHKIRIKLKHALMRIGVKFARERRDINVLIETAIKDVT